MWITLNKFIYWNHKRDNKPSVSAEQIHFENFNKTIAVLCIKKVFLSENNVSKWKCKTNQIFIFGITKPKNQSIK